MNDTINMIIIFAMLGFVIYAFAIGDTNLLIFTSMGFLYDIITIYYDKIKEKLEKLEK